MWQLQKSEECRRTSLCWFGWLGRLQCHFLDTKLIMSLFHCKVFNDLCCYKRKPKFLSMTCNTSANITSPSSMMFQILQDTPFLPRPVLHLQFLFLGAISHYPFTLTPSAEMWLTQKGVLWPPDWIIFSQHIFSWHSRLSLHSSYHNWNYMLILISIHWIPVSAKIVISFGHSLSCLLYTSPSPRDLH